MDKVRKPNISINKFVSNICNLSLIPTDREVWLLFFHLLFILFITLSGVRLDPLGTAATTGLFYQPHMIGDCDCGAMGGMKIGRVN
jgi:hypothetical protein